MKKVLKILTLIMLILALLKIGDTYSKYYSEAYTSTLSQEVGKWIIKINEMDIYSESGDSVEFEVENFKNFSNENADPGKISPSSEGYTDIIIDPTGTDVAIRYDIKVELTEIEDLEISTRIAMASGEKLVKTGENTYSGIISLSDVQAENTADVRCYIVWNDDEEDEILYEDIDIEEIKVSFSVTVTQYLGEELVEWEES